MLSDLKDAYLLDDITVIWDEELTEAQWFDLARLEFFACVLTNHPICHKTIGPLCTCKRVFGHQGPCMGLEMDLQAPYGGNTGRFVMDVKRAYPVHLPDLLHDRLKTLADIKPDTLFDPASLMWDVSFNLKGE